MAKSDQVVPVKVQKIFVASAAIFALSLIGLQLFVVLRWAGLENGGQTYLAIAATYLFLTAGLFLIPFALISSKSRLYRLFLATVLALSAGLLIAALDSFLSGFVYARIYSDGNFLISSPYLFEMGKATIYLIIYSLLLTKNRKIINS
jgi:hypothetical protein